MDVRLICTLLVLSLLNTGFSGPRLKCFTCYSTKSWADCNSRNNGRVFRCPSILDTCMAVHRVSKLKNGSYVHQFAKSCFTAELCTRAECEKVQHSDQEQVYCGGREGALECCSTSLCNRRNPRENRHSGIESG